MIKSILTVRKHTQKQLLFQGIICLAYYPAAGISCNDGWPLFETPESWCWSSSAEGLGLKPRYANRLLKNIDELTPLIVNQAGLYVPAVDWMQYASQADIPRSVEEILEGLPVDDAHKLSC